MDPTLRPSKSTKGDSLSASNGTVKFKDPEKEESENIKTDLGYLTFANDILTIIQKYIERFDKIQES